MMEQSPDGRSEMLADTYGHGYLDWKDWSSDKFGVLESADARYFASEIKNIGSHFPPGSEVLEIGFGNGKFLKFAQNNRWNIRGLEINQQLVNMATERGFEAFCTDSLRMFEDASFALVVAFDVLEHIDQNKLLTFLEEVKRVLKPNGHFLARFPNGDSPFGLAYQNGDITHVTSLGSGKIEYFAKKLSVDLVYLSGEQEKLIGRNSFSTLRRVLSFFMRKAVALFIHAAFYPRKNFCSSNLVVVFRKSTRV